MCLPLSLGGTLLRGKHRAGFDDCAFGGRALAHVAPLVLEVHIRPHLSRINEADESKVSSHRGDQRVLPRGGGSTIASKVRVAVSYMERRAVGRISKDRGPRVAAAAVLGEPLCKGQGRGQGPKRIGKGLLCQQQQRAKRISSYPLESAISS